MSSLPPRIERVIAEALEAAGLRFVEGRQEVERELRAHFEDGLDAGASADELISRFGDPVEAGRRIARTRPAAERKERGETGRWWMSVTEWWMEASAALRRLAQVPGFAMLVVLTLGLGVGANTAVFTVLDAVLLRELPYQEPQRLVRVYEGYEDWGPGELSEYLRAPLVAETRTWDEVFESLGVLYTYREVGADLTDGVAPVRVGVTRADPGYFETLGVRPAMGRAFGEADSYGPGESTSTARPGALVAILSHELWRDHYGADPGIIGRAIELDGASFEVVGIMPPGFRNPFGAAADVWVPQDLRPGPGNNWGNFYLSGIARLKDGLTVQQAEDRLGALFSGLRESNPEVGPTYYRLFPLQEDIVGTTRRTMILLLAGAAALVLLTACVNVANLLFARGLGRDRDLALRAVLGSGRPRLIAGILLEHGILALAGGALGLALGWVGVELLGSSAPNALPSVADLETDGRVFLFALTVTGLALVAFGLTPALRLSRAAPAEVLRAGDRSATIGRGVRRIRDGLIVVQVAAALVLVTGSTLLTRSFRSLVDVPLVVEADGVLTYEVHLPESRYPDGAARHAFHERLHARVSALPGVEAVGATSWLPVNGRYHSWSLYWDPENPDLSNDDAWYGTDVRVIAGDYFGSLGIDVLTGDDPKSVDMEAEPVVWVNRTLVEQVFGNANPLGLQIRLAGATRRIVGVVEDVPHTARGAVTRKSYVPHAQYADNRNWALIQTVKTRGEVAALRESIRAELAGLDPQLVLYRPASFASVLDRVRTQDRFAVSLMGAFALLALVLSLVGTYGVLAGSVAGRFREFGIRMALGAAPRSIRDMVLGHAVRVTVPGILLGIGGAWIASRWIEALLFEVPANDPWSYGGAALLFLAVALVSGWLPAARATRVDPARTLAEE